MLLIGICTTGTTSAYSGILSKSFKPGMYPAFSSSIRVDNVLGALAELIGSFDSKIQAFQESKAVTRIKHIETKGNEDDIVL